MEVPWKTPEKGLGKPGHSDLSLIPGSIMLFCPKPFMFGTVLKIAAVIQGTALNEQLRKLSTPLCWNI